jgi:hypothetical protein
MAVIKILGGSIPKQSATYLFGILTIKDNNRASQTYVSKEEISNIEKVSDDKKSITFKLTLKDKTHFVGNAPRKIYDKLVVDQVMAEQSQKDGYGEDTSTPKITPHPPMVKKPVINIEKEKQAALRVFAWLGAILLFIFCFVALGEQSYLSGLIFVIASILLMPPMKEYLPKIILNKKGWIITGLFILGVTLMPSPQNTDVKQVAMNSPIQKEILEEEGEIKLNIPLSSKERERPKKTLFQEKVDYVNGAGWLVQTDVSPIDDSKTIYIRRRAYDSYLDDYGREVTPELTLRCKENKTEVMINWNMYLGLNRTNITVRLDDKPAQTKGWTISTDNKASFAPSPIGFIKSMLDRAKMVVRITPYGSNTKTVEFGVNGLKEEIKPLRNACSW